MSGKAQDRSQGIGSTLDKEGEILKLLKNSSAESPQHSPCQQRLVCILCGICPRKFSGHQNNSSCANQEDEVKPLKHGKPENEEECFDVDVYRLNLAEAKDAWTSMHPREMEGLVNHDQMDNYRKRFENLKTSQERSLTVLGTIIHQKHHLIRSALEHVEKAFNSGGKGEWGFGMAVSSGTSQDICSTPHPPECSVCPSKRDELQKTKEQLRRAEQKIKVEEQITESVRAELRRTKDQLKSLKNRIAGEVDLALETGKTINLKNPVSKPILIDFYKELCYDWKQKKNDLSLIHFKPNDIKGYIKDEFNRAYKDMQIKKHKIDEVFQLENVASGRDSSKDKEYKQLTIQNLQLCFYNKKSDLQSQNPSYADGDKAKIIESLKAEWYWLACLMALNNPPLRPDWDNPPRSADKWDIFPQTFQELDSSRFPAQGVGRMENARHALSPGLTDHGTSF
ncbi:uncharacterized protein LOC111609336 isoform X2 [Xiphophorus maculatus]|uniref:uncharacterized protein LOC111609336 isoform X2 n=1 Tax=Xiphophorus maculatus TaxID=8083 RepID=UPI000C6EF86C|nr:uncharacterized protein LOC111609336 isoform X2 [Xiphophorus maculatus]